MIFRTLTLADRERVLTCFRRSESLNCEYTFGNLYAYQKNANIKIAYIDGCFVARYHHNGSDSYSYSYPVGGEETSAIQTVLEDAEKLNINARFFALDETMKSRLTQRFPGKFVFSFDRDHSDYLYLSKDLIHLEGKKYQPKRNHIRYFIKNNNWRYETITAKNKDECLLMNHEWLQDCLPEQYEQLHEEEDMIRRCFEAYDELHLWGGLLRCDNKVIAYTMGEIQDKDTFCVHYEKAFAYIRGAYPMINQQFVQNELSSFRYINREDDLGIENLRKTKLSYHPCKLIEKYTAQYCPGSK